jgi:RNA polymerase sigma factor (sigma-70 family)
MEGQPIAAILPAKVAYTAANRLEALFDTHYERLYRLARRLVPSMEDALDLVQETFLRAARSLDSIPMGTLSEQESWLVRVLINLRRDQWRKDRVRVLHAREQASGEMRSSPGHESALIARATLWRALDQLNPRQRAIVVMHELDAISVPDIAAVLGISAITVRWHLSAGRRKLARAVNPFKGESHERD